MSEGKQDRLVLKRRRQRGNALVEFALVAVPLLTAIFGIFDVAYVIFARTMLRVAAAEGVRYAMTARVQTGQGHDQSIRNVVRQNALGLFNINPSATIAIRYYNPATGAVTASNAAGNIVEVAN
jgi:Flp pilus assembly protein TadG